MWDLLTLALEKLEIKSTDEKSKELRSLVLQTRNNSKRAQKLLRVDFKANTPPQEKAYFPFFLTCIYFELGRLEDAVNNSEKAISEFRGIGSRRNEALAFWVFGELNALQGKEKEDNARDALQDAIRIFKELLNYYNLENGSKIYKKKEEIHLFIKIIEERIQTNLRIFPELEDLYRHKESKPPDTRTLDETSVAEPWDPTQLNVDTITLRTPTKAHIIIPVDIDALEHPEWPSTILTSPYTKLDRYNRIVRQKYISNMNNLQPIPINSPELRIFSFPLYGEATAGLRGGSVDLQQIDMAPVVKEDLRIEIQGSDYQVQFINQTDPNPTVLENKICGWIKVAGNSMNLVRNSNSVPLNDGDYALFDQTLTLNECLNKIAVVSVSENLELPPQPMIKWLRKNNQDFVLESSSTDRANVNILVQSEDLTLHGLVVAVAKPI